MSQKLLELGSTKILDVQSMKFGTILDSGYDLYLPEFNEDFLVQLKKRNPLYSYRDLVLDQHNDPHIENKKILSVLIINNYDESVMLYSSERLHIYKPITIPTGMQFLLPDGYYGELRNRSSNFGKNFDIKTGIIDNSYTYDTGFQLTPIDFSAPTFIDAETRIAQIILLPLYKPQNVHYAFPHFEQLGGVIEKREQRTGGFGSTGSK